MSEHSDHGHGHGEFPGPDTHQAPWVMWVTLGSAFFFVAVIYLLDTWLRS